MNQILDCVEAIKNVSSYQKLDKKKDIMFVMIIQVIKNLVIIIIDLVVNIIIMRQSCFLNHTQVIDNQYGQVVDVISTKL